MSRLEEGARGHAAAATEVDDRAAWRPQQPDDDLGRLLGQAREPARVDMGQVVPVAGHSSRIVPFLSCPPPGASLGESFNSFFDAVDSFFSNLASVRLCRCCSRWCCSPAT